MVPPLDKGERVLKLLAEVKQGIEEITVDALQDKMIAGDAFVLVDVREGSEWDRGHLPNAQYMSRGTIEFKIESVIPDLSTPMVLYCGGGNRSALAAESLQRMGYTQVVSLIGGFRAWQAAGGDVVQDD